MRPPWVGAVRRAAGSRLDELGDRLDAGPRPTPTSAPPGLPAWVGVVRVLQWLLLLAAARRPGLDRRARWPRQAATTRTRTQVGGVALALVLLVGGVVVGLVLGLVCRLARRRDGPHAGPPAPTQRLREAVNEVTHELVVEPVEAELAAYAAVRDGARPRCLRT